MAVVTRACSTMMRHSFRQVTSHVRNLSILTPVRPTCVVLKGKVICEMNTVSQWRRWYGSESGGLTEEALNLETVRVLKLFDKVDPDKVTLESHFINDLGLDSLDSVEIVMAFEDEFGVEISDEEAEKIFTCKDAVEILKVKLDIQ